MVEEEDKLPGSMEVEGDPLFDELRKLEEPEIPKDCAEELNPGVNKVKYIKPRVKINYKI